MATTFAYGVDSSTLILNGRIIKNLIAGDYIVIAMSNPATARTNGSDNSVAIQQRVDQDVGTLAIKILKNSEDDRFLNDICYNNRSIVLNGSLVENIERNGENVTTKITLEGGSITTQPTDTRNNQDGNSEMDYTIEFRAVKRNI